MKERSTIAFRPIVSFALELISVCKRATRCPTIWCCRKLQKTGRRIPCGRSNAVVSRSVRGEELTPRERRRALFFQFVDLVDVAAERVGKAVREC